RLQRGPLRVQRRALVTGLEEECKLQRCIGGGTLGMTWGTGCAVLGDCERMHGQADHKVIRAQGRAKGGLREVETHGKRRAREPLMQGGPPGVNRRGCMFHHPGFRGIRASGLQTDVKCGSSPVEADNGSKLLRIETLHGAPRAGDMLWEGPCELT